MAWAKLDDGFYRHRKARAAGRDGRALFVASLCWCGAHGTNGRVATADLQLLAAEAEVRGAATARRLVEVGLWEVVDDGWVVHDYLDWNPAAEKVAATRAARAEAGRKGGRKSRPPGSNRQPPDEANGEANASANEKQNGTPSPSPSLTGENHLSSSTVRDQAGRRDLVEAAVVELGRRDVERYLATGGRVGKRDAFEARCVSSRRADHASDLHRLAHAHPDWTSDQLADAITDGTATATTRTVNGRDEVFLPGTGWCAPVGAASDDTTRTPVPAGLRKRN